MQQYLIKLKNGAVFKAEHHRRDEFSFNNFSGMVFRNVQGAWEVDAPAMNDGDKLIIPSHSIKYMIKQTKK